MPVVDNPIVIKYNGNNWNQVDNLTVNSRVVNNLPERALRTFKLARADGSITTSAEYVTKRVTILGVITAPSRTEAETSLDSLRALLADDEGELDIEVGGLTRRFIATLNAMATTVRGGYVNFSAEFVCAYPFGSDTSLTELLASTANTDASASFSISVGGSYRAEPLITITYSSITDGTGATVDVFNDLDGIGVSITRDWVSGDVLEIDNYNKTARVNGVDVTRSGRFFYFQPGSRSIGYSDNFTARTMTIGATYTRRYV